MGFSALASLVLVDVLGTIKIGRRVRELAQIDLIKSLPPIQASGGLKGEEKLEKMRYF